MAGLSVPLGEFVHFDVVTHDPATGGRVTATSITFNIFEEGTDTAILGSQTLTERAGETGVFRGTFEASTGSGFEVGKYYSVIAEATAGGVVGQATALVFRVVAAESVAGVPEVDVTHFGGGAIPAPAVTGVPDVNMTHHVDVAASITNSELDVNVGQIIGTAPSLTGGDIDVNIASTDDIDLSATQKASVNAEVDTALDTTITELSVAQPATTPTLRTATMLLYMMARNQFITQTSGTDAIEVYNDAGTKITSKLITDAAGDYTEAKMT